MSFLLDAFKTGPDRPPLEDRAEVDRLYRRKRLASIVAVTVGYGCTYTCRLGLAAVKKPLIDGRVFDANQLGIVGQCFFYAYAVGKFLNGFFGDHANVKRLFAVGILCSAAMNLLMGTRHDLTLWQILWGLNGYFQSTGAPTGAVVLANWFSNNERGRYYGVFSASHSLGEGLSFLLLGVLITAWGWRFGFWGPAALCAATSVAVFLSLNDRPQTLGLPPVGEWRGDQPAAPADPQRRPSTWQLQLEVVKTPAIWLLGLAAACMTVTRYAINSWAWLYLQDQGYSQIQAGATLALNTVAGMAGAATFGYVSDKCFGARRPPVNLIYALLELLALSVLFFWAGNRPLLVGGALFLYGFSLNGLLASLGGLFAIDLAPKRAAGAAMGFMGIFGYVGAGLQERLSGYLIQRGTTIVDGVRHCDYSAAIVLWLGASVVSMIVAATLWRARPRA